MQLEDLVIALQHNLDLQALVLVAQSGNVYKYSLGDNQIENVGALDSRLLGASFSPNQDVLVLVTESGQLLALNNNFDVQSEISLDETGAKIVQSKVHISWKNDGKYFVTNYELESGRKALTRDSELNLFRSAAQSDPDGGVVQSVSEVALRSKMILLNASATIKTVRQHRASLTLTHNSGAVRALTRPL